jgi:hypothetical protein
MVNATIYQNRWTWDGKTEKYSDTSVTVKEYAPAPTDPFPEGVKYTSEITILAETTQKFQEELSKIGITTTVTRIEPHVWVETVCETCTIHGQAFDSIAYTWHHWLHMGAVVFFDSDKPLLHSPIDPVTLAALIVVIKYLILVTATALVIYAIATTFIESFFVTSHTIQTYDPTTGKWTSEVIKEPSIGGTIWMIVAVIVVAVVAIVLGQVFIKSWPAKRRGSSG